MAREINIVNGTGTANVPNGEYTVTASVNGYENASILPASVTIVEGTDIYEFTIAASGNLTLHVTEDGTSTGTPVVGATFKRADAAGNVYGEEITTDEYGFATLPNVPYAASGAPAVYYVQLSSDGTHEFDPTPVSTTLTSQTVTVQVANPLSALRTINLYDANYDGLPISSGTISLE